ncbi:MAG: thioredoxin domain-containing protein [Myxococcota bacterium]
MRPFVCILIALCIGCSGEREPIVESSVASESTRKRPRTQFRVEDAHQRGPDDAWVTAVVISDFECSFCARVEPTLNTLTRRYPAELRLIWKHNPLPMHSRAMPASVAAECAGEQDSKYFWGMHDALFRRHNALDDEALARHARTLGLEMDQWRSCVESGRGKTKVKSDQQEVASAHVRSTPTVFINGRFVSGARSVESYARLIDEEVARGRASGLSPAEYYRGLFQ